MPRNVMVTLMFQTLKVEFDIFFQLIDLFCDVLMFSENEYKITYTAIHFLRFI